MKYIVVRIKIIDGLLVRNTTKKHYGYNEVDIEKIINNRKKCPICKESLGNIKYSNNYGALCNNCKDKCCMCHLKMTDDNQYKNTRYCISCKKEYERKNSSKRRQKNKEFMQDAVARSKLKTKLSIFSYYSNGSMQCVGCNYSDMRALSIDHINGGGCKHRDEKGNRIKGEGVYRWIKRNKFPPGFQVLCMNCQFIKRIENNECRK